MHMRSASGSVRAAFVAALLFGGAAMASRVEFKNNRLEVDGKPFFFYGCWNTPNKDYAEFRRRRFNTAFMAWRAAVAEGAQAAAAGLMVVPYPYAPGWSEAMKEGMTSIADKDWVLAWNIGDDLRTEEHIAAALKVRGEMQALDPQKRPIMFDAIGRYEEFGKIPDMWCAYAYALVKPAAGSPPARKPAGLQEYGKWLDEMRKLGRPDGFFWTWGQCHVQVWYSTKFLGGSDKDKWRPSRFPDGDQLRLIAAHAISAGCRGLMWFVHFYFQDDHIGRDRYARAAVIGCELDVVGPLIAQGRTGARLTTSDPSVWATPIDFPGGRLICLLKTGEHYNYQPDAAAAANVRVDPGAPGRVYRISSDFRELNGSSCSFDLASWLLVTEDAALVEQLRKAHQAVLPDMARFSVEELEARIAKVQPVFRELGRDEPALGEAQRHLAGARDRLAGADWPGACRLAEDALRALRAAQRRAWDATWADDASHLGLGRTEMADFYLLPTMAGDIELLKKGAWGENQLDNGDFEADQGWGGVKLGHDPTGKSNLVAEAGRDGSRALRLASESPSIYQGKPQDWVTANVVSGRIPAKGGEFWEIAAWVRVPKSFERTARGVTIALFAYDEKGKRVRGYGAQDLEAVRVEATDGWERLRLIVPLRSAEIASVAARLALCGVGEAHLDDVTVRRLTAPAAKR